MLKVFENLIREYSRVRNEILKLSPIQNPKSAIRNLKSSNFLVMKFKNTGKKSPCGNQPAADGNGYSKAAYIADDADKYRNQTATDHRSQGNSKRDSYVS